MSSRRQSLASLQLPRVVDHSSWKSLPILLVQSKLLRLVDHSLCKSLPILLVQSKLLRLTMWQTGTGPWYRFSAVALGLGLPEYLDFCDQELAIRRFLILSVFGTLRLGFLFGFLILLIWLDARS
jgi:hypothetical protein